MPETPVPVRAKLDFNESPYDVPDAVKEKVLARLEGEALVALPGVRRRGGSRRAIAAATGRSPEEIVVGNGSGEVVLGRGQRLRGAAASSS